MDSTCNCTCYDDKLLETSSQELSNNTTDAPSSLTPQEKNLISFFISMTPFLLFLVYGICWCFYLIYAKYRSYRLGPLNYTPLVPKWLTGPKAPRRTRYVKRFGVVVQTRDYRIQYDSDKRDAAEKTQGAIKWVQRILKKRFGKDANKNPYVYIPKDTCLVSVPMENFKCGQEPTDFEPVSGKAPGSFLTYQMCGDNRIQITRYVEGGVVYVAGYCVYIRDPYARKVNYNIGHIEKCYKGPRYVPPEPSRPSWRPLRIPPYKGYTRVEHERILESSKAGTSSEASEESDFTLELRCRQTSKLLKINFCETLKKPVMIGLDSGVVKHYEWLINGCRQVRECKSCQLEKWEDNPPPYHLLKV